MFIMLDGIDGSGKSTILETWKNYLSQQKKTIFDLTSYIKKNKTFPRLEEMYSYDCIMSSEPTMAGIGKVIREELTNKNNDYSNEAIAQAFSLDRLILYKKIIIPILSDNRCVLSDRGISTSLAYQTLPGSGWNLRAIANLPGNKLSLQYRPDHLVILKIAPEIAAARIAKRENKKDHSIFEKLETMRAITRQYESKKYLRLFQNHGTVIHRLPTEDKIDIMQTKVVELLKNILNN